MTEKWKRMTGAPADRDIRLKCSDGRVRIGRRATGGMWAVEGGAFVLGHPQPMQEDDDCEMIYAESWKWDDR